jgi:hypothetical protein
MLVVQCSAVQCKRPTMLVRQCSAVQCKAKRPTVQSCAVQCRRPTLQLVQFPTMFVLPIAAVFLLPSAQDAVANEVDSGTELEDEPEEEKAEAEKKGD